MGTGTGTGRASGTATATARRDLRDDRGTAILEFTGMLPLLLFIGMAAIQLGIVGYSASQAGSAARAAARTESLQAGTGAAAGQAATADWLQGGTTITVGGGDTVTATATIRVPSVLPGIHLFGPVHRTVTMPRD